MMGVGIRRPVPALLGYYVLQSIAAGPGLVVLLPLKIFRYRTLRYEFDAEGMTARWGMLFRREISLALTIFDVIETAGLALYVLQAIGTGLILRLDYEQRWYLVSNRSLRIREGLVRLQERTMTFANVQHVAIRQNPIQRWLGIADVEVRTAGGGGAGKEEHDRGSDLHIAYLRGVVDADRIRDVIRERLKRHADTGLGDPDDVTHNPDPPAAETSALLSAAQALRDEAQALRLALTDAEGRSLQPLSS